jgi:hypothetical protein
MPWMMIWIRIKENGYIMDDNYYEREICYVPRSLNVSSLFYDKALRVGDCLPLTTPRTG